MKNIHKPSEQWIDAEGTEINVTDVKRTLTTEDTCPECSGGIRYAEGMAGNRAIFRIECLSCLWRSEALPNPQA